MGETAAWWGVDERVLVHTADDVGFDELFAREYVPMVRLAVLLLGNEEEAEEVVQEAFAAVLERWDRVDRPGDLQRRRLIASSWRPRSSRPGRRPPASRPSPTPWPPATARGRSTRRAPEGLPADDEVGFTGPNDRWHRHATLCRDAQGVAVLRSECAAGRATETPDVGGWMTHAWVVPGCESDWGMFSGANPPGEGAAAARRGARPGLCSGRSVTDPLALDPDG